MTVINILGLETGFTEELSASAGTFSVTTSTPHVGTYCLRCNPASSAAGWGSIMAHAAGGLAADMATTAKRYYTFFFRFASLPSGTVTFASVETLSAGTTVAKLQCTSGGVITAVGATTSATVATISAATWYRMDFDVTTNATSGAAINGGTRQTFTASNQTARRLVLGRSITSQAVAFDCSYDDAWIDDAAFPTANSNAEGIHLLKPIGAGGAAGWTNGTGNTFAEVDDWPNAAGHDGDTTYIGASATMDNLGSDFDMTACATAGVAGTIRMLKGVSVARTDSISGASAVVPLEMKDRGTTLGVSSQELIVAQQVFAKLYATAPNDAAAWTSTLVDGVTLGVHAGTIAQAQRCTALGIMVWSDGSSASNLELTPSSVTIPIVTTTPTISETYALAPSAVTIPIATTTPTIAKTYALTPTPIAIPIAVTTPTLTFGAISKTPDPVTIPIIVSAPTVTLRYTISATPVTIPIATPAPTITLGALALTPSPVPIPVVVTTPTISKTYAVAPSPVAIPIATQAPTIAKTLTLTPASLAIPIAVPSPTIALSLTLAPTPTTIPLVVPIPTVTVSGAPQTLTPDPVTVPLVIPSPSVSTQLTISPAPVTVPIVVPAPSVSLTTTLQPTPVTVPIVVSTPAITTSLALAPTPVAIPLLAPVPTVTVAGGTQTIAPDPVPIPILVPVPTVSQPVPPVPPIIVVGGGWRPSRQQPPRPELPRWQPPRTILRPEPVRVTIEVLTPARVGIDWLSVARREDEELMMMGVL